MSSKKVVHLTIVHPRSDTRITYREVRSLCQCDGWETTLMVADGKDADTQTLGNISVAIHDLGKARYGRIGRAFVGSWRAIRQVRRIRPNLVHFHDPELIPAGMILKLLGCKVIYDVHEDVPRAVLDKYWLPRQIRGVLSSLVAAIEWLSARIFDALVCATPKIAERFPMRKTIVVQNFPILAELETVDVVPSDQRNHTFVYVGAIAETRGAAEMIDALQLMEGASSCRLDLAGEIRPASLEDKLQSLPGWQRVEHHGWITRVQVAALLAEARAGLVVLHPTPAYIDAYPVKMFEYMSTGLPVIASDFPLWRQIVEGAECGILVDSLEPRAIADAMQWILEHPAEATAMGQRGRRAVEEKYNWIPEEKKLLALYDSLLGQCR